LFLNIRYFIIFIFKKECRDNSILLFIILDIFLEFYNIHIYKKPKELSEDRVVLDHEYNKFYPQFLKEGVGIKELSRKDKIECVTFNRDLQESYDLIFNEIKDKINIQKDINKKLEAELVDCQNEDDLLDAEIFRIKNYYFYSNLLY
jgi:hypothetical protein